MKGKASLLVAVAATTAVVIDAIINPQVLVVMPQVQNNGQFQYVQKKVSVRRIPEVRQGMELLESMGSDPRTADIPKPPFETFKQTRWLEPEQDDEGWHTVRTGKECSKEDTLRAVTLSSYDVPVKAQVISDGGQTGVWANCITQGGFYRWIVRIRHLLTP